MFDAVFGLMDLFIHLDKYLPDLVASYGSLIYAILFVIIFCETGLVITPFLPGDSLLFITGTVAGIGGLNIGILLISIYVAAILGDTVNYFIGKFTGQKIIDMHLPMIRQEHLDKTHEYFTKYGPLTIIIARFAPFIRTFAPFLAGMGAMEYKKFLSYNVIGGVLWVTTFLLAGYFLGTIPFVKENMSLVALAIILISFLAVGTLILELIRFFWTYISGRFRKS
jgi:membrane-associated protein